MRKWIAGLGLLALFLTACGTAAVSMAEQPVKESTRTIEVTGRGTLTAKPDTAIVSFGVTALAPTPTAAYQDASKLLLESTSALQKMGVKEEELKTTGLNLGAEYNWTQDKGQILNGYRATTTLTITTQNLDKVAEYIEAAVGSGANTLQGISFTVKDTDALLEKALDLAADNAQSKAVRVAERMGAKVTGVIKIQVMDQGGSPVPMYAEARGMDMAKGAMPVYSGTQDYSATISATFELK